jgi:hypothetical protein
LENSFCTRNINVIAVLRVCAYNKFLNALRAFHSELIDFSGVEITDPSFDGVESDTFGDHVLAAFAPDMKGSLISNFSTSDSFAFNNFEGFVLTKIGFFGRYFFGVVVF